MEELPWQATDIAKVEVGQDVTQWVGFLTGLLIQEKVEGPQTEQS